MNIHDQAPTITRLCNTTAKGDIKVEYKMKYNLHFIKVFTISLQTLRNNLLYNSIVKITLKLSLRRIRYLLV